MCDWSLLLPQEGKQAILSRWKEQLQLLVYRLVGALRIAEIFEIVTDYPDSSAAVDDLQECMKTCSVQKSLVKIYCHACSTRLHIPGTELTIRFVPGSLSSCKMLKYISQLVSIPYYPAEITILLWLGIC